MNVRHGWSSLVSTQVLYRDFCTFFSEIPNAFDFQSSISQVNNYEKLLIISRSLNIHLFSCSVLDQAGRFLFNSPSTTQEANVRQKRFHQER